MILPVVAYGDPVLRKKAEEIDADYNDLNTLIENMWETMYNASGIGLAAPQIGLPIRLFLVDTTQVEGEEEGDEPIGSGIKKAFINATILEKNGKPYAYTEGCLSIPKIREDVVREENIIIEYYDTEFKRYEEKYEGVNARVIMHEYDHIEGILFLDYLKPLKRRLMKKQLDKISKGDVDVAYKMKFPNKSKKKR